MSVQACRLGREAAGVFAIRRLPQHRWQLSSVDQLFFFFRAA
jgi:hypothetical protein